MTKHGTKAALITGAGQRIGKAIALGLAENGWRVGVHYGQSQQAAEDVCNHIRANGGMAVALQADLADSNEVEGLTARAVEALGPLTALINNASLFERDTAHDLSVAGWGKHLHINLRAPALLMRDFAKQYAAQDKDKADATDTTDATDAKDKTDGNIINIIDQRVWRLTPNFVSYTVSKTGLWTLTQTFAQALAQSGIRVNAIGPGPTLPSPRQTQAAFDKQKASLPLGHGATPDDIMQAVRYILDAHAMTGQMIALDGGQHLAWQTREITDIPE